MRGSGNSQSGQLSVEMVIIASAMVALLLAVFVLNEFLKSSWEEMKQSMQASLAAHQVAYAINRVSASGNSSSITFFNRAGPDVVRIEIFDKRSVRAYYIAGGFSSAPLVTNNTNITSEIPLNQLVTLRNIGGKISRG
ncbi:MAG: hypothetical protein N3F07_03465 [Candidatus Micrarchaeota archaeon]|nr:hypothetical protein [Candidatus Micrarchaeota archaeon]